MVSKTTGSVFNVDMELDMVVIPMNRTPNPRITIPMFCIFCLLQNIYITTPAITNSGASAERLKEINWEVTVVPMFAPMMTPAA